jgi:hypothetical protein
VTTYEHPAHVQKPSIIITALESGRAFTSNRQGRAIVEVKFMCLPRHDIERNKRLFLSKYVLFCLFFKVDYNIPEKTASAVVSKRF